ncbi:MAG: peroxidase family protein [Planctomycetota bacterium]
MYTSMLSLALVAGLVPAASAQIFRSLDGSGNHPVHTDWGASGIALLRRAAVAYPDGIHAPAGTDRPSARFLSTALCRESLIPALNEANASDMFWQWGQFLDHDLDLTPADANGASLDIPVPVGDPWFDPFATGNQRLPFTRSVAVVDVNGVHQQVNFVTAFLDGSNVYGSDTARALALRTLDGTGRLLVDAADLLPRNTQGIANEPSPFDPTMFLAGDVRSTEQSGLAAMHTLWVREHNAIAAYWRARFPGASGDLVYELSRALVVAELQHITYSEFLPLLLGPTALAPYTGWQADVDPGIANEFSSVAYRFGHSMLSDHLLRLDSFSLPLPAGNLPLRDAFFNPTMLTHASFGGIGPLLRGLSKQRARSVDSQIVSDVRNFLFGPPGAGGIDLASLNIQRARDHGIPSYAELRGHYGLSVPVSFADIPADTATRQRLAQAYWLIDRVDPWIGAINESHVPGALVGELAHAILVDQFTRLRDGDRYWYATYVPEPYRAYVESQRLCDVLRRNTELDVELADDVFRTF